MAARRSPLDFARRPNSIARATYDSHARDELLDATGLDEVVRVLARSAEKTKKSLPPRMEKDKAAGSDPGAHEAGGTS